MHIFSKFCDAPVVIDVGANVGKWSEQVKAVMPESTIYAVEPIPEFFSQINDKIVLEKHNLALSDKLGSLSIFQSGGGAKSGYKKGSVEHKIQSILGDDFVSQNITSTVDLIKIDTDGFDYEVIKGLSLTIETHRPVVQFEVSHWWLEMGYTLKVAERFFNDRNYLCMVYTDNGLKNIESKSPEYLFITANIFAIPDDKLHMIQK